MECTQNGGILFDPQCAAHAHLAFSRRISKSVLSIEIFLCRPNPRVSVSHGAGSVGIIVFKSAKEAIFYECTSKDSRSR